MHQFNEEIEALAAEVLAYSLERMRSDPPLDGPLSEAELFLKAGNTVSELGMGGEKALKLFAEVLAPSCISTDHPRYLSFIPSAPSEHATLFDLVVGSSALYAGSWLEGAGAVYAENQALRWISDLAGLPATAGGVFVQGGTVGNLSALVAARAEARERFPDKSRWVIAASSEAHSSIQAAAEVMDALMLIIPVGSENRMNGSDTLAYITNYEAANPDHHVFVIVATAGTTNLGIIDDLESIGLAAKELERWFHVDGAYGLAALCAPSVRTLFNGVERADSLIVDPHKWLFAPFDACALIYRDPKIAKKVHTQHASYLETLEEDEEWNPTDYSIGLTRRARGLPFWFSLASNGSLAYSKAVEKSIAIAKYAASLIKENPLLELLYEPSLSIVAFKRVGWAKEEYDLWSKKLLADQIGFVVPSRDKGEAILRFAIVNPWTREIDIKEILDTLG